MKMFVGSDIHGSIYYAKKMIEAFEAEECERMLLLGDVLYHGPRNDLPYEYAPKEVIALLNEYKEYITCVRGNCEAEVDQMVLDFEVMDDYKIIHNGKRDIFMTHGHNYNQGNLPYLAHNMILLHGHTHIPALIELDKCIYMNPGSVSIPKNDSCHSYMVIEDNRYIWKDLLSGEIYKEYKDNI
ncbi:MAG: phosphodiesterase [Erysipelotrichaceae bacterium]|nr:phosphodiesterase [Erysipelotrichaceae bacterium]